MKEDELQSILNYLLTMHEVHESLSLLQVNSLSVLVCHFAALSYKVTFHLESCYSMRSLFFSSIYTNQQDELIISICNG